MEDIVALFTRAWIEIHDIFPSMAVYPVALFTRAWIEIATVALTVTRYPSRPLHEGVD